MSQKSMAQRPDAVRSQEMAQLDRNCYFQIICHEHRVVIDFRCGQRVTTDSQSAQIAWVVHPQEVGWTVALRSPNVCRAF